MSLKPISPYLGQTNEQPKSKSLSVLSGKDLEPAGQGKIQKRLSIYALEMVTSGKLKADQAGELSEILAYDLRNYPMTWVEDALRQHKEESPFWPSLSDLMKFIKPRIVWQQRAAQRIRREDEIARFKANEEPDDPVEIRKAAVEKWRQDDKARLMELAQDQQTKRKKWVCPSRDEMRKSVLRIAEFERASGEPDRIAVANKMIEGIGL